jgi:hypothetical protein
MYLERIWVTAVTEVVNGEGDFNVERAFVSAYEDVGDVVAQVKEFEVNAGDFVANEENRDW